jgi:adenylate cyclase
VLATGGALLCVRPPSPLAAAERLFEAVAFRLSAPVQPLDGRIVVIGITEDTLDLFPYRSPIDRTFLAGVLDQLASAGVAAIGLDVLLDRSTEPAKWFIRHVVRYDGGSPEGEMRHAWRAGLPAGPDY